MSTYAMGPEVEAVEALFPPEARFLHWNVKVLGWDGPSLGLTEEQRTIMVRYGGGLIQWPSSVLVTLTWGREDSMPIGYVKRDIKPEDRRHLGGVPVEDLRAIACRELAIAVLGEHRAQRDPQRPWTWTDAT